MAFIDSGKNFDKKENQEKLTKRMDNMDISQYPLRIPTPLYQQVKIKLAKENKKLRTILIEMLEEYIKK